MPMNRCELLSNWYLRFNGYFTTPNFTVHPDYRKQPGGTDADILAVRFPYSEEYQEQFNFDRDPALVIINSVDFLICEVKSSLCDLNKMSWGNPSRKNVEYAIRWLGFEQQEKVINCIADDIYKTGAWYSSDNQKVVRFACIGEKINDTLLIEKPNLLQIKLI